jgi:hypothetical protein
VIDGAKALAMTAIDVMTDTALRAKAHDDFAQTASLSAQSLVAAWHGSSAHGDGPGDGDATLGGCGCC